ncbi:MAG TPA: CBS domain-containing protein [Candidatus Acidoferrales bacterium]|nr:CBS domain-containing protein [Candidatus Acidoferrales bacterium]
MLVRDRMSRKVISVQRQDPIAATRTLMHKHGVRQFPVVQQERLVGIVTDRDLRSAPASAKTVSEVMTSKPTTVGPDVAVDEAARLLRTHKIGALPVVENGTLIGILAGADVLDAFVDLSGVAEPTYHVILTATDVADAERQIRRIVEQERGELKWIHHDKRQRPPQVHLRLKARRIDDIVTELEAVGFEVAGVVGSSAKGRR